MGTHTGPILEGAAIDYERYVRVPELLELQKPVEQLSHPEERLFQTTHQAAELWLHHVDYEIGRAIELIAADDVALAADLLDRCARIINLLRAADRDPGDDGAGRLPRHPHQLAGARQRAGIARLRETARSRQARLAASSKRSSGAAR